jgi:hypothetical protein
VRDKLLLTQALVANLPEEFAESAEVAARTWWANIRKTGGLRLTDHGFYVFSRVLELTHYDLEIQPGPSTRRTILSLDRKLQSPYYIKVEKRIPVEICMFGSREAVVAQLYGNLEKFLVNY